MHFQLVANGLCSSLSSKKYLIAAAVLAILSIELWLYADQTVDIGTIRNYINDHGNKILFGHLSSSHDKYLKSSDKFVQKAVDKGIYKDSYDGKIVRKLCKQANWRDDLIVSCDRIGGGIGNLKTNLLGCARYAIEAGAALITPVIHPRQIFSVMEYSFGWDVDMPIDYVFDAEHFYSTLQADCPQLHFVNETDPNIPPKIQGVPLKVKELEGTPTWYLLYPELWRTIFDNWLTHYPTPITKEAPARVSFNGEVQFTWPTAYDGPNFKRDWGLVAQFSRDIRELGARILYQLYQQAGCQQDPAIISTDCFLGVHLRTEADAAVENWASYETQLQHIQEQLTTSQLAVLYVASGNRNDVQRLREDVAGFQVFVNGVVRPLRIVEKWDLAIEADTLLMGQLTWDQLAIVDLEVMLRASRFAGISSSSWTWMVALTRHLHVPEEDPYEKGVVTYEDGLSVIYGAVGDLPMIDPTIFL